MLREQIDAVGKLLMGYVMECQQLTVKPNALVGQAVALLSQIEVVELPALSGRGAPRRELDALIEKWNERSTVYRDRGLEKAGSKAAYELSGASEAYEICAEQLEAALASLEATSQIPEGYYLAKRGTRRVRPQFYAEDEAEAAPSDATSARDEHPSDQPIAHVCASHGTVRPYSTFACSLCRPGQGENLSVRDLAKLLNAYIRREVIAPLDAKE